jgi:hypothetical protein
MLEIGNAYGHGFGPAQIVEIERAGFTVRPETSHYAGSQICRFLDFEDGPALELIEVADEKAYLDFVPKGMKPYAPGLSLVVPDYAERELADFAARYPEWGPYALHVNYDGSDDPGKPGWSYLNFERPVIRDTFLWLTRLDKPRPHRHLVPHHPNGALGVVGLVFDLPAKGLERVARLAETKTVQGAVDINGVKVVRVNDLKLDIASGDLVLTAADVGPRGFFRRVFGSRGQFFVVPVLGALTVAVGVPLFVSATYLVPRVVGRRWAEPIAARAVPWLEWAARPLAQAR